MDGVAVDTPPHDLTAPRTAPAAPAVRLAGVARRFRLNSGEEVHAVDGVNLDIPAGQFVCVLGPSGHGKTTMLNLIAGFLKPSDGVVETFGNPVVGPGPDRGVVFQRDTLFTWKRVSDNIGFGLRARGMAKAEREEIVQRYLALTGLERFARAWPKELSGGMRRRVAIAAVFANEPRVLLMDEPFVGLDYGRRAQLHGVLLELWQRARNTVFFVTHDAEEALALGDRILVVTDGRIRLDELVELERPRTNELLSSPEANALRSRVLTLLNPTDQA